MRVPGFYWIRCGSAWEVAFWNGNNWERTGDEDRYTFDRDLDEIDEREVVRPEP